MIVHHRHPSPHAALVEALFRAIESNDLAALEALYDDALLQVEHPNRLLPGGARRTKEQVLEAARRGRALMRRQEFELTKVLVEGDTVALACAWEGTLAVDAPPLGLRAGEAMRAHFAQFLTLRDGRVVRHDTYDCFAP